MDETATSATTERRPRPGPSRAARRAGYVLGTAINLALLWLVNVSPGWRAVPLLTEEFAAVVGWVSLSLLVGGLANVVYLASDPRWIRRSGDAITAAASFVVLVQLWVLFPFDLGAWSAWTPALRVVLAVVTIGTAIAVPANLVQAVTAATDDR